VALGLADTEEETISLVAAEVDEQRIELGLDPDPAAARLRGEPCLSLAPAVLEGGPAAFERFRAPRAPARPTPDWWPRSTDPLVYASFGSVAGALGFFPGLYGAAIDVLADLPVQVLLTAGEDRDLGELGALPSNVHAEP